MTASFGNGNGISSETAFFKSFGNLLSNKQVYSDIAGFKSSVKVDLLADMKSIVDTNLKAYTTSTNGDGSMDRVMIPLFLDPMMVDITRKQTPVSSIMPRVANRGLTAEFNTITEKNSSSFKAENAEMTDTDPKMTRNSVPIKYLYISGSTTGQVMATQPAFSIQGFNPTGNAQTGGFGNVSTPNANAMNILLSARSIKEREEETIINGSVDSDPLEFDGIIATMGTTNATDKAGTQITSLEELDEAVSVAYSNGGLVNVGICDVKTFGAIKNLITAKIGFLQSSIRTIFGFTSIGINTISGTVDLIPSRFLNSTSGNGSIYFLDMSVWEMRVLSDLMYEPLAKTKDADRFMLKMYLALICRAPTFNSSIINIAHS